MSVLRWRLKNWTTSTTCLCSLTACARRLIRTSSSPARESMTCWSTEAPRSSLSFPSSSSPSRVSLGRCPHSWFTNHTHHGSFPKWPCACVCVCACVVCVCVCVCVCWCHLTFTATEGVVISTLKEYERKKRGTKDGNCAFEICSTVIVFFFSVEICWIILQNHFYHLKQLRYSNYLINVGSRMSLLSSSFEFIRQSPP